jgi:hypothetical protein
MLGRLLEISRLVIRKLMQPLWKYIRVYLKIFFKKDLVYDPAMLSLLIYAKQLN